MFRHHLLLWEFLIKLYDEYIYICIHMLTIKYFKYHEYLVNIFIKILRINFYWNISISLSIVNFCFKLINLSILFASKKSGSSLNGFPCFRCTVLNLIWWEDEPIPSSISNLYRLYIFEYFRSFSPIIWTSSSRAF